MNRRCGFIQIPLLIAIISAIIVVGGTSYYLGTRQYQNKQQASIINLATQPTNVSEKPLQVEGERVTEAQSIHPTPAPPENLQELGHNYLESEITFYNSFIGAMDETIKAIQKEDVSYFTDRKNNLVFRLSYAKQLQFIPNNPLLNQLISSYWQAFENDIADVDAVFNSQLENISLARKYREVYVHELEDLQGHSKFITRNEFTEWTKRDLIQDFPSKKYEPIEKFTSFQQNYLASVGSKEDNYEQIKNVIIDSLVSRLNSQPYISDSNQQTRPPSISDAELNQIRQDALNTLRRSTCTWIPGPTGGFSYSTINCN